MKPLDPTVRKETVYIAAFSLVCSMLLQAVFLVIGKWDYTVLLGNVLGLIVSVGNFLLLGITVQKALGKEEKDARDLMRVSQRLRTLMLFAVALVGYLLSVFNTVALVSPYLFPRLAIAFRPFVGKK